LVSRKLTTQAYVLPAKEQLVQIVNMLMGLLKRRGYGFDSRTMVAREEAAFEFGSEQEHEHE
jgi:hypothetical protein